MKKPIGKLLVMLSAALCLLSVPAFAADDVAINEDNFPDSIFRTYVSNNFDTDGNGSLSATEISAVQEISVYDKKIQSLKGIEYFENLTTLYCSDNQLTELDVSKNTALETLYCDNNQLTALDVSKNTALEELKCTGNSYIITLGENNTFDLSNFPDFDITKASNWIGGTVDGNTLTVTANFVYYDYDCGDFTVRFILVDGKISVAVNEENFPDAKFRSYVSWLDKNDDGKLNAKEISAKHCMGFSTNSANPWIFQSLKGIEYFGALTELDCGYSYLTELDVSKNIALTYLYCCSEQLTELDVSKNTALTSLVVRGAYATVGGGLVARGQLTKLDVSKNTALTKLNCEGNQLTALDVSKNTALQDLNCSDNQLTALDVSKNTALWGLSCSDNQLTALDVSKNTALTSLDCSGNPLTELDVSKHAELENLYCSGNQLTELDVSKNTALEALYCSGNELTELDVSKNTALKYLYCGANQLTALDVSGATALKYLYCWSNQLTSLDVSRNTALTELDCSANQLTELDVSKNTALVRLDCGSNQLTSLDLGSNTALWNFACSENVYTITLDEGNKFDLSSLPGFDVTKASEWVGGTVEGTTLTVEADTVTYDYDCGGNKTTSFTLTLTTGHIAFNKVNAKAATCTEDGNKEYWHCSGCGKDFLDEAGTEEAAQADIVIPALGHSFTNYVYNNDAKVGVDGTETAVCDRDGCGATDTRTAEGTALPESEKTEFSDVPSDAYYAPAVDWAVANNVVYGTSATTFAPNEKCTRAQVVAFLWRAAGRPEHSTAVNPFTDVNSDDYFYDAVLWAVENNIVYGTSATTFEPHSPCTRAQVAAFLYRAKGRPEPETDDNPFRDVSADAYYYDAVLWAVGKGVVYGTSATTFEPNATCTRAQGVAFLYRAYGK